MSEEKEGKGLVAGGGVLAVLVSALAHGADDCARVGAKGAAMSHVAEQGARVGAEAALVGKGAGVAAADGAKIGARGAALEGAQGARLTGAKAAAQGEAAAELAAKGARASEGRQMAAKAWLSPAERQPLGELPGHTLDVVDLAGNLADLSEPGAEGAAGPTASVEVGAPRAATYLGKVTYLPLHSDFQIDREKLHTKVEALEAATSWPRIKEAISRVDSSPLLMTGWIDGNGKLGQGEKAGLPELFALCHGRGLVCFALACQSGAPSGCNRSMARLWHTATAALGSNPAGEMQMARFSGAMHLSWRSDESARAIWFARSSFHGEARFLLSTPGTRPQAEPAPTPQLSASSQRRGRE